ncbi:MAG: SDR family NAD(P)-dependent oxidoreductase [Verrucomicrobiota bacterium]
MNEKVFTIAPLLRGLLGKNGRLPGIRFEPEPQTVTQYPPVTLSGDNSPAAIAAKLSELVTAQRDEIKAVHVNDIGLFSVLPVDLTGGGRAMGKIALVTGAAQGFGLEIASDLAAEGARVVMADINEEGARKAAEDLKQTYGKDSAFAVAINVTDSQSTGLAIQNVVKHYGGLDMLVSNAGVLKAGSVKTQTEKDFDFVTSVNYRGFFLMVKATAHILSLQHSANSEYTSDIIQINSKSGLAGSNRNAAYAGSKFGAIGLVQSFAMELIEDGIKVNAICPGNFFDGPLWSDPEAGLFVQYLSTGKVPGAKTIEDVRRAYEKKIPMGRGCRTEDVMKALYYLMEQQYETGQAIPVTGGQVMLK